MEKIEALAQHLSCAVDDLETVPYDESMFRLGEREYLILTDEEADERTAEQIKESLWAFRASFLSSYTDLPEGVFTALQEKYEDANETVLKLVERTEGGLEGFVSDAIGADGRGHFLSSYDSEEREEEEYYIYRMN